MNTTIQELWTPIFPATKTVRLRYATFGTLSSTSGVVSAYVYSANGLYDPDISGLGHQPMGFDQMMLSYEHYTVLSSNITFTFKNTTASNPTVAVTAAPSSTNLTNATQIVEFGGLQSTTLEIKGVSGAVQNLSLAVDVRKIEGGRAIIDNPNLQGDAASNPAEQVYFIVYMWDNAGFSGSLNFDVVIEFLATFKEPRQLTQSLVKGMHKLVASELKTDSLPVIVRR